MTASLATDNSTEGMQASVGSSMAWASGEASHSHFLFTPPIQLDGVGESGGASH